MYGNCRCGNRLDARRLGDRVVGLECAVVITALSNGAIAASPLVKRLRAKGVK
jgi:hypothetical protein